MKKILITGGCGFVGRHLTNRILENSDIEITVVDNMYKGSGCIHPNAWPSIFKNDRSNVNFVYQDCRDFFKETNTEFDQIYHLAAIVGGRMVIENDPLAVGVDLSIDAEFFYWLSKLKNRPEKVHYFSSSASYPINYQKRENQVVLEEKFIDFDTEFIGVADLTYGWSKLTGEFLAKTYHKLYGANIICYRPFSGYGPDQDLTYPFPSLVKRAMGLQEETEMTVWGSGMQVRDFVHIEDCISLILNHSQNINDGSAINISTGIPTNFNQLAQQILNILDKKNIIVNSSSKPEGVFFRVGDRKKQLECGFKPKYSLEAGILETIKFFS